MSYIGNSPALKYTTFAVQHFTTSATTGYTLDNAVTNENDIRLVINNVVQQPGGSYAYTAAGTVLTLSAATTTSDTMYCVFLGKAVQTVNPGAGSVGLSQLSATGTASSSTFLRGDNAWQDPGGVALATSTNNQVVTVTGADAITGETNFIYDGTIIGGGADGANADLGSGLHIKTSDTTGSVSANSDNLVLEENGNVGLTMLSATNGTGHIFFGNGGDEDEGFITYDSDNNRMRFGVNAAERMRILGTGTMDINIGGSTNSKSYWVMKLRQSTDDSATNYMMAFANASDSTMGSIQTNGTSSASYNTSSDYRLKENETSITDGIERLKQLKPYKFNFKTDADKTVDGFFAHEVSSIVPEAISGEKDAMIPEVLYTADDELPEGKNIGDVKKATKINPQQIDQAKLVPLLTSALQEAITKIETLETEMTALKARVTTLEE